MISVEAASGDGAAAEGYRSMTAGGEQGRQVRHAEP